MARLGVRASVQPAHLLDDRDVTQQWWPDGADRCFAPRSPWPPPCTAPASGGSRGTRPSHTFYDPDGSPCYLYDDGLVLPADATEADRFEAWRALAEADAFWRLFPDA